MPRLHLGALCWSHRSFLGTFVPSILFWVTCLLSLHLTHSAYAFALVRVVVSKFPSVNV